MATRSSKSKIPNNKVCRCLIHDQLTINDQPKRIFKTSGKDFSKKSLNILIEKQLFTKYGKYCCSTCIEYGTKMIQTDIDGSNNSDADEDLTCEIPIEDDEKCKDGEQGEDIIFQIDNLIKNLKSASPVDDALKSKLSELMFFVGKKFVRNEVKEHCTNLSGLYYDVNHLQSLNSKSFLADCKGLLVQFLSGSTGVNPKDVGDTKILYRFAVAIESIYHMKNSNTILPHSFQMNLIQKQVSGSKMVCTVNSKVIPGGSDTTMRDWWKHQGSNKIVMPSSKDVVVYFDNVGKYIVKAYRVKGERNDTPTVISAVQIVHLTPSPLNRSDIFLQSSNSPYISGIDNMTEEVIQKRMLEFKGQAIDSYRVYRYKFVQAIFSYMLASVEMESYITDELSAMKNAELTRVCSKCGTLFPPRKQKCDKCGSPVVASAAGLSSRYNVLNLLPKYLDVGQVAVPNPAKIVTAEPIMINPNSIDNVERIIDDIKKYANVEGEEDGRKWLFIGADGQPASYMRRLKQRNPDKYKWLLILSGKGHLKMNMVKGLFKFSDQIFLKFLAQDVLKFDTMKSYNYFIKCKDTHKSYQALEIMLFGTTMELIRTYGSTVSNPSPLGFLQWTAECENPNQKFMCEFLLNYVLAMYVHKVGDRYNDAQCSDAGRMKFFDLFCALNHPIYREVEYNDLRERVIYSEEVSNLRKFNTAYKNNDDNCNFNHQDGDFKLEERVKKMKRMSPKGKMNEEMWQRVARGMDNVDLAVEHGKDLLHLNDDCSTRITKLENEIVKWRSVLRNSGYLTGSITKLTSMDGKDLNPLLRNFTSMVEKKREQYFRKALSSELENIRYEVLSPFGYSGDDEEMISPFNSDSEGEENE